MAATAARPLVILLGVGPRQSQQATGNILEAVRKAKDGHLRLVFHEQVNVIVLAIHFDQLRLEVGADFGKDCA